MTPAQWCIFGVYRALSSWRAGAGIWHPGREAALDLDSAEKLVYISPQSVFAPPYRIDISHMVL